MPWVEASLRGQKVLAKIKADGKFDADGGRVEIRYKATDTRAYRAAVANLSPIDGGRVLPDDACAAGEFVASTKPGAAPASGSASAAAKGGARAAAPTKPLSVSAAETWISYTDGACSGNPGPAGSGYVVIVPGGKVYEGYDYLGTGTNNIAELTAILRALEAIPADAKGILLHTDSQYAIGVLTKGWKPKVNQKLIATIKAALKKRDEIRLIYVPGHAGVPLNERADELAREAISRRASRGIVFA